MLLRVLPKLAKGLLVGTLVVSLGAHWALLQSVAWAGMLYTYSQQAGLAKAIAMTFDGDHPCALCKKIQRSKTEERQESSKQFHTSTDLKLDLPSLRFVFIHPPQPRLLWERMVDPPAHVHAPELPPPRMV